MDSSDNPDPDGTEHDDGSIGPAIDALGDRWSLLILRDVIFRDRRYFRALLGGSREGIASNILADRLVRLVDAGVLVRGTAARGQRARYSLTESGIGTVPILLALGEWADGSRGDEDDGHVRPRPTPGDRAIALMEELRARHLDAAEEE